MASTLLTTMSSGHGGRVDLAEHDRGPRRSGPAGSGSEPSTTCSSRSAAADLLQRGAERVDQLVREVPDEADGVGERVLPAVGGLGAADGRVEGGEQRVLDQHAAPVSAFSRLDLPALV
jgi:hypothetical protein